jgi:hypothetical protein
MKRNALIAPLCCLAGLACAQPRIAKAETVWPQDVLSEKSETVSTPYATGSVLVNSFNVFSVVNNVGAAPSSPKWGYIGVLGGVLGMGLGGASLMQDPSGEAKPLAIANIAIGAVATFSALSVIRRAKHEESEDEDAVTGHNPVHFKAGIVGAHQHGLGVQLKF